MEIPVLTEREIVDISPPRLEVRPYQVEDYSYAMPSHSIARYSEVSIEIDRGFDAVTHAFNKGRLIEIRIHGWHFRGYVTSSQWKCAISGQERCRFTVRPSGPVLFKECYAKRAERIARTEMARAQLGLSPSKFLSGALHDAAEHIMADAKRRLPYPYDYIAHRVMGVPLKDIKAKEKKMPRTPVVTKESVKRNKFYVGSKRALIDNWGHDTIAKAIEHGKGLLEENDGEEQFIVKIVRVVRRKPQPVIVEEV